MKLLQNDRIPSRLTLLWGGFIIASASFMRQLYSFISQTTSREVVTAIIWVTIFSLIGFIIYTLRNSQKSLCIALLPLTAALLFAYSMEIVEERIHIVKYGILGFLLFRDFSTGTPTSRYSLSLVWGLSIGVVDESFQWILPYRVGDIRDVIFNSLSVVLGAMTSHSLNYRSLT